MSEQALNVYDYAEEKGAAFRVAMCGVEWMSRCIVPGCSSQQDAFSVQPEGKRTGRWAGYGAWMCRKCWNPDEMVTWKDGTRRKRGWGTLADLVMLCEKMSYRDAEALILAREGGSSAPHAAPRYATQTQMTDDAWYAKYVLYLNDAFQNKNEQVSTYCASRGLTDETITFLKFGFSLDPVKMKDETYRRIPFLVIPWHKEDGTLYRKVNRRNLHDPLPAEEDKYRLVSGSQKEELYLGYTLKQQKRPTFLVESELCAATILQEVGDLVNVVATGSVTHGKNAANEGRLRRQPFVFVAFDADTDGEEASLYWLSKLDPAKCLRYRPLAHDVSEMHTTGLSVRTWVENALQLVGAIPGVEQSPSGDCSTPADDCSVLPVQDIPPVDQSEPGQADTPSAFSVVRICCRCAASPAGHTSPGGDTYCAACYRCDRCGHAPQWVYDPAWKAQVCQCVMDAPHAATQIYPPYSPCVLAALPRIQCPYRVLTFKDNHPCSTPCKGKTFGHGWCADHAYAHELLCLGAALGYPAVHGDYRHIEQGVENWEAYAECVSAQHAQEDMKQIRARHRLPHAA